MKVSKGQSQPEIVAAAFLILHMVLGTILVPGFDCDSDSGMIGVGPAADGVLCAAEALRQRHPHGHRLLRHHAHGAAHQPAHQRRQRLGRLGPQEDRLVRGFVIFSGDMSVLFCFLFFSGL